MSPADILRESEARFQRAFLAFETAQRERDDAIREAHRQGVSTRRIAEHVSVSHQRVAQVVKH